MKNLFRNPGLVFALWALLVVLGCHKNRPQVQQASLTFPRSAIPKYVKPEESPSILISLIPIQPLPSLEKPPRKPRGRNHSPSQQSSKKPAKDSDAPAPAEDAKNAPLSPPRLVIQEGANASAGDVPAGAAVANGPGGQSNTQQLLDDTEKRLNGLKRDLSSDEKSTKAQILDYIDLSHKATKEGDNVRAYNLALKAHELCDELVKVQ